MPPGAAAEVTAMAIDGDGERWPRMGIGGPADRRQPAALDGRQQPCEANRGDGSAPGHLASGGGGTATMSTA